MAKERGEPNRQVVWERDAVNGYYRLPACPKSLDSPLWDMRVFSGIFWG
jgi:hypothetical protein